MYRRHSSKHFNSLIVRCLIGVTILLCLSTSLPINAYPNNQHTDNVQNCQSIGTYKICGDQKVFRKLLGQFGNILDFNKIANNARNQTLATLKNTDPNVTLTRLSNNNPIQLKWQRLTNDVIKYFSFEYMAQNQYAALENTGPIYKIFYDLMRRRETLLLVDLSRYPDFLTINKKRTHELCSIYIKKYMKRQSLSPYQLKREKEKCYLLLTGNLESAWNEYDKRAVKTVYFAMASMWGGSVILEKLKSEFRSHSRTVYIVNSEKSLSPKVDSMGNVYLPKRFLENKYRLDLDLILTHEAAHIRFFTFEQITKLLFSYLPQIVKVKDPDEQKRNMTHMKRLLRMQQQIMEMNVDTMVVVETFHNKKERARYPKLIGEMEALYPERKDMIGILDQLADTLNDPSKLYTLLLFAQIKDADASQLHLNEKQAKLLARLRELTARYFSAIMAGYAALDKDKHGKRIDPMELEDHLVKMFKILLAEYELQLKNR